MSERMASVAESGTTASRATDLVGRVLIAVLFVSAGIAKLAGAAPYLAHMAAHGVPGLLLPAVIALEIGGGLAILAGILLRPAAFALACFSVATALLFHLGWADHVERTMFFKDIAIGGGLFVLAATRRRATRIEDALLAWVPSGLGLRREMR